MQKDKYSPIYLGFFTIITLVSRGLTAFLVPIIFLVMAIIVPICVVVEVAFCSTRNLTGAWLSRQIAGKESTEERVARLARELMKEDN